MARHDDDRIAYLAGEDRPELTDAERAELDEVRTLLAAPATWDQPAQDLEDRVVAAIAEEASTRSAAGRAGVQRSRRPRWRLGRPAYALAGFAAAAAAVIAIIVAGAGTSPAPERFAMVVSGTALAPEAHGSATLTKTSSGWRIELSASGLPRLAGGRYYQAWLKNPAGLLVPVGTFNDARHVTLWSGVPPTEYPTLTVTRQRADGNPASSGQRVLVGTIRRAG
jgi:hypothetical protein